MFARILTPILWGNIFNNFITSWNNWTDSYLNSQTLSLGGWFVVLFVLLFLGGLYLAIKGRFKKFLDWINRHLSILALILWFIGVIVYMVGFYKESLTGLGVVPRAIVSSFKMFVVSNDLARVDKLMQEDAIYMALFSLIHFIAALIAFLFIFKLIGFKIKSSFNIILHKWRHQQDRSVHLFWGVDEASCLLAEDINKKHSDHTIIFIDVDQDNDDNTQKKASLSYITNAITIKNSDIARLDKINALIDHCYNGPAGLSKDESKDVFSSLHLKNIGDIVKKSNEVRFYFLSDDERQNISGALNMQFDEQIRSAGGKRPEIFVHARRSANNEIFDHYSQYEGEEQRMKIKIVDSAYLSVAELKQNDSVLPINCVEFDKQTGLVSSPSFNALIVGFGETGQEAFKFLYEFSALMGNDMRKIPFKCYAVDEKMDRIAGLIRKRMTAITKHELSLIKTSVDSEQFWDKTAEIIDELSYAVITLNDDSIGLSLGVNLFKYALQHRSDKTRKLKILVRCYEKSNERRIKEVAENLNRSAEGLNVELVPFGMSKDIYSYENITLDTILKKAKEFNRVYENSEKSAEEQWKINFGEENIDELIKEKGISRYHAIYDINRRIEQNISNVQHCRTKLILMGILEDGELNRARLQHFYERVKGHSKKKTIKYDKCNKEEERLLQNLAVVEHERWVASHKLLGYTYNPKNDFVKKYRDCMCPWSELKDEKTKSYDCKVVDTTIEWAHKENMEDAGKQ